MRYPKREFEVALSFAGEDRVYVERVADKLRDIGLKVFYDKYESVTLWGKNLYDHLSAVYSERAQFVVLFISRHYKAKVWTNHERESAQARAFKERKEYILPVRFDSTRLPGLLETVGYLDAQHITPDRLAHLIRAKLHPIQRQGFWPERPDAVYRELKATTAAARLRIDAVGRDLFSALTLMTRRERRLLFFAGQCGCIAHSPKCSHIQVEFLARLTRMPSADIIATFARLDCLGVKSWLYQGPHPGSGDLGGRARWIEWSFRPRSVRVKHGTDVVIAIVDAMRNYVCPTCAPDTFSVMDFSVLSRRTRLPDAHEDDLTARPNKRLEQTGGQTPRQPRASVVAGRSTARR